MILIQVALYSPLRKNYIPQEAIIDTGANICAIAEHVAERFRLSIADETSHLWQVRDPLVVRFLSVPIGLWESPISSQETIKILLQ